MFGQLFVAQDKFGGGTLQNEAADFRVVAQCYDCGAMLGRDDARGIENLFEHLGAAVFAANPSQIGTKGASGPLTRVAARALRVTHEDLFATSGIALKSQDGLRTEVCSEGASPLLGREQALKQIAN